MSLQGIKPVSFGSAPPTQNIGSAFAASLQNVRANAPTYRADGNRKIDTIAQAAIKQLGNKSDLGKYL